MTGEAWRRHLETYVALRRAVGFAMRPEARLLQDFIEHLERRGPDAGVAQVAVEWASADRRSHRGPAGDGQQLPEGGRPDGAGPWPAFLAAGKTGHFVGGVHRLFAGAVGRHGDG